MIAAHNQNSSRAGSRLGQLEDIGTGTPNNISDKIQGLGEVKEERNQEAPRRDESLKRNSTTMPNTTPSGGVQEDDDDEEEDEEDGVRVGEMDEEEDDEEVESVREREIPGPEVVEPLITSNGRRGTIGVGMGMVMKDTSMGVKEPYSSGGGGMGGYWNRQSRPSSPRMPPPEQPETRPKSRYEPVQPARYNNLGYWRARRVTFYKNGDPYFPGVEFRLVTKIWMFVVIFAGVR